MQKMALSLLAMILSRAFPSRKIPAEWHSKGYSAQNLFTELSLG
jgi:hypothetical protein